MSTLNQASIVIGDPAGQQTVTMTTTTADLGRHTFAELGRPDGLHDVRSPVLVRPVPAPGTA